MGVLLKVAEWVGNGHEQMLFLVLNWCQWNTHTQFPRSTSATRAISLLSPIILPLQTFFSRVLLRRQQVFSPGNFARQGPKTRITTIETQVFMFRYERVNSKRKFTIVAEIVFLLKKICKRDVPLRAMFNVKTLAVLFSPYPREMKTNTAKFKSAAILTLTYFYGNCVIHSHARQNRTRVVYTCALIWLCCSGSNLVPSGPFCHALEIGIPALLTKTIATYGNEIVRHYGDHYGHWRSLFVTVGSDE